MTIRPKSPQNKPDLTAERLRELLHYDPKSGVCVWLVTLSNRAPAGTIAGGHSRGYRTIGINGTRYFLHRIIWFYVTGKWPRNEVDHRNCNGRDNRWSNLREATSGQNSHNMPLLPNNTSGKCGVAWDKSREKWMAYLGIKGKRINLGRFTDKFDAIAARRAAEIEHFGEFRHQPALDS